MSNKEQKGIPVISVDFRHYYSTVSEDIESTARICLDMKAIQNGLLKEIGANRVAILLAIISYMDSNGQAFPSQEKIAEITGQGRATIQRNLDALCEVEFNGQKLLHKDVIGSVRKRTVYTINQALITNTDAVEETFTEKEKEDTVQEQKEPIFKNARDIGMYFLKVFEESFGYKYNMVFKREMPLIKNKLLGKYDNETVKAMIDIGVGQYKNRWANDRFPHPTVSMLCGWVGNEALGIYAREKEKAQELDNRVAVAQEQDDTDRALDLFDI